VVPEEPFIDLGRARSVRGKGQGFSIRLPLVERLRIARGLPQAVVKVVSYARGLKRVSQLADYISRKGALELETETGERVAGRDQTKALVENWSRDFDPRKNGRDTTHLIFSMPPGSDPEALRKAVRTVGARAFPHREWMFGIHQDKNHPHAHMIVKMRGRDLKKLRLNKPELYHFREIFAEAAREQGVQLAASPRAARGVGKKAVRQPLYYMRQRGIKPEVEREAGRQTVREFNMRATAPKPWERAMEVRNAKERLKYIGAARALRESAAKREGAEREKLLRMAKALEAYGDAMPRPKTRRQVWLERLAEKYRPKQVDRNRDEGLERER
jgi:hypothetical protein